MLLGYNYLVILLNMKTAVFIPDPIFDEAEKVAERRGISRSQLYAEALQKMLDEEITAQLNQVYGGLVSQNDSVLTQMQALSIEPEVWEEAPKRATPAAVKEESSKRKPTGVNRAKR